MNLSHNVKHVKAKAILQLQKVLAEFHQFSFCTESFPLIGWNNLKAIFLWNANNSAKTNTITRELSYWIFLKMFHIHLNIQRLNIGGFRGDEMDLPDNLDSFHPLKVWIWSIKMTSENKANYYEIVMKFQNNVNILCRADLAKSPIECESGGVTLSRKQQPWMIVPNLPKIGIFSIPSHQR